MLPYACGVCTKATWSSMKNGSGLVEEVGLRNEVGVEDREVLALRERQGVVDVARLRAVARQPSDVVGPQLGGEIAHGIRSAVVEDPRGVLAADRQGGHGGLPNLREVFAVDGDEHVHADSLLADEHRPELGAVCEPVALGEAPSNSRSWVWWNVNSRGSCPPARIVHIDTSACETRTTSATMTSVYGSQSPRFSGLNRNSV